MICVDNGQLGGSQDRKKWRRETLASLISMLCYS